MGHVLSAKHLNRAWTARQVELTELAKALEPAVCRIAHAHVRESQGCSEKGESAQAPATSSESTTTTLLAIEDGDPRSPPPVHRGGGLRSTTASVLYRARVALAESDPSVAAKLSSLPPSSTLDGLAAAAAAVGALAESDPPAAAAGDVPVVEPLPARLLRPPRPLSPLHPGGDPDPGDVPVAEAVLPGGVPRPRPPGGLAAAAAGDVPVAEAVLPARGDGSTPRPQSPRWAACLS